jgi:hypothetical protein
MATNPPPFYKILATYEEQDPKKIQRVGQWFFNRYLRGVLVEVKYPYNLDALYNSTDFQVIFEILEKMYQDYQWEM